MLKQLNLHNFKQHKELTVTFSNGLNLIQGDNGSGKTTVLKAILYALFGSSAAGSKEHLTNWEGGVMNVELIIDLPELGEVKITRSNTKAKVETSTELLASGQTGVTAFLETELGMSGKILKNLLCAEQGEAQGMLRMGAAGLQEQLEIVAKAETIDKIIAQLSKDSSRLIGQVEVLKPQINLEELKYKLTELKAENTLLTEEVRNLAITAKDTETRLNQARERLTLAQQAKINITNLNNQIEEQLSTITRTKEVIKRLTEWIVNTSSEEDINAYLDQIKVEMDAILTAWRYLVKQEMTYDKYKTDLAEARKNKAYLSFIHKYKPTYQELKNEEETVEIAFQSATRKVKELRTSIEANQCKLCGTVLSSDLTALKAALESASSDLMQATTDKERLQQAMKIFNLGLNSQFPEVTLKTKLKDFEDIKTTYLEAVKKLSELEVEKVTATTTEQLAEINTRKLELENKEKEARNLAQELNINKGQLDATNRRLQEAITKYTRLNDQLNEIGEVENPVDCANTVKEIDGIYQAILTKLHSTNTELQVNKEQLLTASASYEKEKEKIEEYKKIAKQLHLTNKLLAFLRKNRSNLLQESWDALVQYASNLISSTTDGLMTNLLREEGSFYIHEKGRLVPVNELSGARKSLTGLCLRLALANTFYGSKGFTLLDEVTADATEENAARVAGMLRSLNMQVIMVSHRLNDALNAQNVIVL